MSDFYFEGYGYCPIYAAPTKFVTRDPWFRDHYRENKTGTIAEFMEVFVTRKTSIADSA